MLKKTELVLKILITGFKEFAGHAGTPLTNVYRTIINSDEGNGL